MVAGVTDRATGGGRAAGVERVDGADPDGVRRGRRRAGTSVSTYGSPREDRPDRQRVLVRVRDRERVSGAHRVADGSSAVQARRVSSLRLGCTLVAESRIARRRARRTDRKDRKERSTHDV